MLTARANARQQIAPGLIAGRQALAARLSFLKGKTKTYEAQPTF
jgi:hypothetical protein